MEIITISKRIADVILDGRKAHLSDKNQGMILQNQRRYAVIMEQQHHCHPHSWIAQKLQNMQSPSIQLKSQDETVMMTTHDCLKTYYVRDQTRELRPITTKTFIVNKLKHDLLSGKMLNKAGYRIILDEDPEESGVYAVNDGKICVSKSFPFMSKHKNLY